MISNPEIIFINQKDLLSKLDTTKNHSKTCGNEKNAQYELIDLKPNKSLKGHIIGDEIRQKLNPIIKKYCNFLLFKRELSCLSAKLIYSPESSFFTLTLLY